MDEGKLSSELIPDELRQVFKQATDTGVGWKSATVAAAKQQLKEILFVAQNGKCAYCRRMISDEPGHVEIDHILPKAAAGNEDHWTSNDFAHRKSTAGYPQFTFEPLNLALACKRCNNKKGTHDARRNRSVAHGAVYDLDEQYYNWVHIYAHHYYAHIKILQGLIYQVENNSTGGEAVISVCKLDEVAAVEKASAELKAKTSTSVAAAFATTLYQAEILGWNLMIDLVANEFPDVPRGVVEEVADAFRRPLM